jgi:hypothetical protein
MVQAEWRLLTTLPDLPSAHSLAEVLRAAGLAARVMSDAGVLGQAAPSRIYVGAADFHQAQLFLSQPQFTEEELGLLATDPGDGVDQH